MTDKTEGPGNASISENCQRLTNRKTRLVERPDRTAETGYSKRFKCY